MPPPTTSSRSIRTDEAAIVAAALNRLDEDLERRISGVVKRLARQLRIMDELDREVHDIADDAARNRFRVLIDRLDEERGGLDWEIGQIVTYDLFDPLRIAMADLDEAHAPR